MFAAAADGVASRRRDPTTLRRRDRAEDRTATEHSSSRRTSPGWPPRPSDRGGNVNNDCGVEHTGVRHARAERRRLRFLPSLARDVQLVADMAGAYRFSLEWSRIEPAEASSPCGARALPADLRACHGHGSSRRHLPHFTTRVAHRPRGWSARRPERFARFVERRRRTWATSSMGLHYQRANVVAVMGYSRGVPPASRRLRRYAR